MVHATACPAKPEEQDDEQQPSYDDYYRKLEKILDSKKRNAKIICYCILVCVTRPTRLPACTLGRWSGVTRELLDK